LQIDVVTATLADANNNKRAFRHLSCIPALDEYKERARNPQYCDDA